MNTGVYEDLRDFLDRASRATYAGDGKRVEPWRTGFKEFEYREGDWYYRDSYTGHLRSWGQEIVWYNDKPVWACSYGGGMAEDHMNEAQAKETSAFLKQALSADDSQSDFQPRGPKELTSGQWKYECSVNGTIESFTGREQITYKDELVFIHDFLGGIVIDR